MKTNAQFDEAWRDLINARRAEDIHAVHRACERLAHASRMLKLDQDEEQQGTQHLTTDPINPFDGPIKYK